MVDRRFLVFSPTYDFSDGYGWYCKNWLSDGWSVLVPGCSVLIRTHGKHLIA